MDHQIVLTDNQMRQMREMILIEISAVLTRKDEIRERPQHSRAMGIQDTHHRALAQLLQKFTV